MTDLEFINAISSATRSGHIHWQREEIDKKHQYKFMMEKDIVVLWSFVDETYDPWGEEYYFTNYKMTFTSGDDGYAYKSICGEKDDEIFTELKKLFSSMDAIMYSYEVKLKNFLDKINK